MADEMHPGANQPPLRDEDNAAILAAIGHVSAIMDSDDSDQTAEIGTLLRAGTLVPAVVKCFTGDDGRWDPAQSQFRGEPAWKSVLAALGTLATTVLARQHTVHALLF